MAKPDYIGTFPCSVCKKKVRVYGWLPEAVLCRVHEREIAEQEAAMQGPDDRSTASRQNRQPISASEPGMLRVADDAPRRDQ